MHRSPYAHYSANYRGSTQSNNYGSYLNRPTTAYKPSTSYLQATNTYARSSGSSYNFKSGLS